MKGAILDWIRAVGLGPITSASNIVYSDPPSLTDMPDNGLVTKAMVTTAIPPFPAGQIIDPMTAGVSANPHTIAYGDMVNPDFIFVNADGSRYGGISSVVDNAYGMIPANTVTITGDDDGTGHFADSFIVVIKP